MQWSLRLDTVRQYLRESLWFWPAIAVLAALLAGSWLGRWAQAPEAALDRYLFQGTPGSAQQMLAALLGAVITAFSVVLSLTVVVLQTASMQFSPRLLQSFVRDRGLQAVLSIFLGTIAYLLAVLHTIGTETHDSNVPRFAASGALLLTLVAIAAIGYFFHHISQSIRLEAIMRRVTHETLQTIARIIDTAGDTDGELILQQMPEAPPTCVVVSAEEAGYLQNTDLSRLWTLIEAHDLVVRFGPMIGDSITPGTPLAWVWPNAPGAPLPARALLSQYVNGAVEVGFTRTLRADVAFGFRQLIDIALRAISPAVNDPYTAIQALDHLSQLLCRLAPCQLGAVGHLDAHGKVRIARPGACFEAYLDLCCDQIFRYGAHEPTIAVRLFTLLRDVSTVMRPEYTAVLQAKAAQVLAGCERGLANADDLRAVRTAAHLAMAWIDGRPMPPAILE